MLEIYGSSDAASAMLKVVRRKLGQGVGPTPTEALLLYAALPLEEGIGNPPRLVPEPLLLKEEVIEPGLRGLAGALEAYAAHAAVVCGGHAQLDGALGYQLLRTLVGLREILNRALRVLEICCSELGMAYEARVEGFEYAARDVDASIMDDGMELLPLVRRAQHAHDEEVQGVTGAPSAAPSVGWWESDAVPWWRSLRLWAQKGMSDADHAGNWLFPALHRASERATPARRRRR